MFYSNVFSFDGKLSSDFNIHLVSEEGSILNEYGVMFTKDEEEYEEITLSFALADDLGIPLIWDEETLSSVLEWLITDEYKAFISNDNEDIIYFLKGDSYQKKFTKDFTGLINVTFSLMTAYAYKKYEKTVLNTGVDFAIQNSSNINAPYKPIIELQNVSGGTISIYNKTTKKTALTIEGLISGKNVVIDNKMGTITDSDGNNLISKSNRKWIELQKGDNRISVTGDCSIVFKAYYPIMM